MRFGAGWIVYEESRKAPKQLLSILPPSRKGLDPIAFMQQLYHDRHSSILERMTYKKAPKRHAIQPLIEPATGTAHIGFDPWLVVLYAQSIKLDGNVLSFSYRVVEDRSDPFNLVYRVASQDIMLMQEMLPR